MAKIVTDADELRKPNSVATLEEAQAISEELFMTLLERESTDVGLSAPQIGIHKQVCVVRAKSPIVLVNPKIIDTSETTWYQEGCVSFPGASVRTKRHKNITVKVDYLGTGNEVMQTWSKHQTIYFAADGNLKLEDDIGLLESVAVSHEIDHLNGILFFDREWKLEPIKVDKKYGRNERVTIVNSGTNERIESIKYKKAEEYLNNGWTIGE